MYIYIFNPLICCIIPRWDELREEVRAAWLFRFDWWFRTRTAGELQRRVEYLSKLIEKVP